MARPSRNPVEASGCGFRSEFRQIVISTAEFVTPFPEGRLRAKCRFCSENPLIQTVQFSRSTSKILRKANARCFRQFVSSSHNRYRSQTRLANYTDFNE